MKGLEWTGKVLQVTKSFFFTQSFLEIVFLWNISFHRSDQERMTTENGRQRQCGTLFGQTFPQGDLIAVLCPATYNERKDQDAWEKTMLPSVLIFQTRRSLRICSMPGCMAENRKRMGLKTGLPAFFREDRIVPVITLILYFGEEEWDRPVRLHDMLTFPEKDDTIRSLVPDYPIHVISVRRDGARGMDISLLHTELKQVFGFLQHQEDKEGLKRYVEENRAVFSRLSGNAALFLAASAHETRLLKGLNREEEHYDMCRALDEWYADGVSEGEKIGERNL